MTFPKEMREAARRNAETKRLEALSRRMSPVQQEPTLEPDPQITVGQLRELLAEYPDDMLVQTEGCDCIGPCSGMYETGGQLLLTRGREF